MRRFNHKGQAAIEYMLTLGLVVGVIFAMFPDVINRSYNAVVTYYNKYAHDIVHTE